MAKTTVRPKWKEVEAIRRARAALSLAEQTADALQGRLPAGIADSLTTDIGLLTASGPDRLAALIEQKGATGDERVVARDGKDLVMTVREMAKRTRGIKQGDLKALGVGEKLSAVNTNAVAAALTAVLRAFDKKAELAQQIGVLQADLDEAAALVGALLSADGQQAQAIGERKDKTFDRKAVQLRIEASVDAISARGQMAFRSDPAMRARFEALVSGAGPAAKDEQPADQ